MWPAFAALTVIDAIAGHALPPAGESQSVLAAGLLGGVLNVLGLVFSRPIGALARRWRGDLPIVVARDYAACWLMGIAAAGVLVAGLAHRPTIVDHRQSMRDAIARAQAWIGARAPQEFRDRLVRADIVVVEAGSLYRVCVPGAHSHRTYCVVVNSRVPFARSVSFSGYEPNSVFAAGSR
jgi:hypothetical protein